MTIVVAFGSWHIGARVIHRLSRLRNVSIVGQARDAGEAMSQIAATEPRLVILDVLLSQGEGLGVLRAVKERPSPPLVMAASASAFAQVRRKWIREGADYYFYLPDEIDQMTNTVGELARASSPNDEGSVREDR